MKTTALLFCFLSLAFSSCSNLDTDIASASGYISHITSTDNTNGGIDGAQPIGTQCADVESATPGVFYDHFDVSDVGSVVITDFTFWAYEVDALPCPENIREVEVSIYDFTGVPLSSPDFNPDVREWARVTLVAGSDGLTVSDSSDFYVDVGSETNNRPALRINVATDITLGFGSYTVRVTVRGTEFLEGVYFPESNDFTGTLGFDGEGNFPYRRSYSIQAVTLPAVNEPLVSQVFNDCYQASVAARVAPFGTQGRLACATSAGIAYVEGERVQSSDFVDTPLTDAQFDSYLFNTADGLEDRWPVITEDTSVGCSSGHLVAWVRGVNPGLDNDGNDCFRGTQVIAQFVGTDEPIVLHEVHSVTGFVSMAHSCYHDAHFVVWSAVEESGDTSNVYGKLVFSNGETSSTRRFTRFRNLGKSAEYPRVSYNVEDREFVVVWEQTSPEGRHNLMDIYGNIVQVDGDHIVDTPNRQLTDHEAIEAAAKPFFKETLHADIVYNRASNNYLLTFLGDGEENNGFVLYAQSLDAALRRLGEETVIYDIASGKYDTIMARVSDSNTGTIQGLALSARTVGSSFTPREGTSFATTLNVNLDCAEAGVTDVLAENSTLIGSGSFVSADISGAYAAFFSMVVSDETSTHFVLQSLQNSDTPCGVFADTTNDENVELDVNFNFVLDAGFVAPENPFADLRNNFAECDGFIFRGDSQPLEIEISGNNDDTFGVVTPNITWTVDVDIFCDGVKFSSFTAQQNTNVVTTEESVNDFELDTIMIPDVNVCVRGFTNVVVSASGAHLGTPVFPRVFTDDNPTSSVIGECGFSLFKDSSRAHK